jgi:hypothetical protein
MLIPYDLFLFKHNHHLSEAALQEVEVDMVLGALS